MKKSLNKWEKSTILGLALFLAIGLINVEIGSVKVEANNTAQTLPFSQNWTNGSLITTNDDWSAVPGIVGYLGDIDAGSITNVDPRTLLADYSSVSAVDVIANQANPDTLSNGGVAEFDGISNPTIALQGSGTADAPHIIIYLNTTGQSNIKFACNIRDVDGSADDAAQQIDVQYRVGGTGSYTSVPGGYIADATTGGTATQVTPLNLTLPAAANNQALVEVRVITTNAAGSDEWVGIDDINVTSGGGTTPPAAKATLFDFTGNGRTDYTVFTNSFDAAGVPIRWNVLGNPAIPGPNQAFIRSFDYGLVGDFPVPNDYRGDKKVDVTVRRQSNGTYYVAQFPIGTGPIVLDAVVPFGTANDSDGVEADYDGDGKADYTVVRANADNSLTYYMQFSGTNTFRAVPFGTLRTGIRTQLLRGADFNGDGRDDIVFAQFSADTSLSNRPITYFVGDAVSGVGILTVQWGNFASDYSVTPADYTGDGRADLVAVRQSTPAETWYVRNTATGMGTAAGFGIGDPNFANTDLPVRGDYDGDGRHDLAVWRPSNQTFYFVQSSNNVVGGQKWGNSPDNFPLAFLGVF